MPTPEPDDQKIVSLNALRQRRTDDLLSGDVPLTSLLYRRRDRIAANLLVSDIPHRVHVWIRDRAGRGVGRARPSPTTPGSGT